MSIELDVALRLLANLKIKPIEHDQRNWLRDGDTIFEIGEEDPWSCATSGCAAGFIFLNEAPVNYVFDSNNENVFKSLKDRDAYHEWRNGSDFYITESPVWHQRIGDWAAEVLGLDDYQRQFLFYQYGDTDETINRIRFLMGRHGNYVHIGDYDPNVKY